MDGQALWPLDEPIRVRDVGGHGALLGEGPQAGRQCSGDGDDHLLRLCVACPAWPVPLTPSDRRLPTKVLAACREGCPAAWQMAAHVGRIALRPRAVDQGPAGRRVAGWRAAALAPPCTPGVVRRRQAQVTPALAGGGNTGQTAPRGDPRDGPPAPHPTPRPE